MASPDWPGAEAVGRFREPQVGRESQLEPRADRVPLDDGNDHGRQRPPHTEPALELPDHRIQVLGRGQPEDVGLARDPTRREHLAVQAGGE